MSTAVDDITSKTEMVEIEPKTGLALKPEARKEEALINGNTPKMSNGDTHKVNGENGTKTADEEEKVEDEKARMNGKEADTKEKKEEDVPFLVEAKTGVSFPVKLDNGMELNAVGLRKKNMLGLGIKIYAFGIYADNMKLKDLVRSKMVKVPSKPTKEMYQMVIDSDVEMSVKLNIVFLSLTMSMVRKNFDEGLGAAIKKLTGGKNDELTKKIMGEASDDIKLTPGSVIEISRCKGYVLQTKVKGEVVSKVESELLCRAYIYMYLGEDPFDKEAKDKFGMSLLSLCQ